MRRYAGLACFSAILLCLCAEGGLRVGAGRFYTPKVVTEAYLQPNPYLYQSLKPNSKIQVRNATVEVNAQGFRGKAMTTRKATDVYRIFALGGSTTFGYLEGLPRTEDTYPYQLEAELRKRLGSDKIEVVNAGVTGYTTRTSLINFITRIQWMDPDLIIVYHAVNDAIAIRSQDDLAPEVLRAKSWPTPWETIRNRSYLLLDLSYRYYRLFSRPPETEGSRSDEPSPVTLDAYAKHLGSLVSLARRSGIDVVIGNEATIIPSGCQNGRVTGPDRAALQQMEAVLCFSMDWYFPQLTIPGIQKTFASMAQIQRRVAAENQVTWIDMNPRVTKTAEYFTDFCHNRPPGAHQVALGFAEVLEARVAAALAQRQGRSALVEPRRQTGGTERGSVLTGPEKDIGYGKFR